MSYFCGHFWPPTHPNVQFFKVIIDPPFPPLNSDIIYLCMFPNRSRFYLENISLNHERVKLQMGFHRFQKDCDPIVFEKLTLDVTSSIPTEKAMTNLCMAMAAKLIQTPEVSFSRPSVNPAITLWNDNDATTKAVLNKDLVLSAFFSSCRNDLFSSLSRKKKIYQSFCIYWLISRLAHLVTRDWSPKFETGLNIIIGIVQKV